MIRTIILDDERIIRNGIAKIIQENVPEFQVTATFGNGRDCLEYLEREEADLIISDVRMPYIDGLELIRHLRDRDASVDFILISGYDDFEYCRTAIQYGVFDYMLKPIDKGDFIRILQKFARKKQGASAERAIEAPVREILQVSGGDRKVIRQIKDYLRAHYNEPVSLEALSSRFYMNPNYICQLFKQETGKTLTNYLSQVRMERAKQYLQDPSKRINEIAALVGYQSPQTFAAVFKRYCGVTPREYRETADDRTKNNTENE